VSGTGAFDTNSRKFLSVPQDKYAWGERLAPGLAPKLKASHATDPYAGMVRMDTSTGKQKLSNYLTFRVMSERQTGKWIIPAQPGRYIVKKAVEDVQAKAAGAA
jgi:hypothetical protein